MPAEPSPPALLPWLLRRVNRRFGTAARRALDASSHHDLRQQGMWAVQAIGSGVESASELVPLLQITKQAVSALVEELVTNGYVRRVPDPRDRRRSRLGLTPRGARAARLIERTCTETERELAGAVGAGELRRLRAILTELGGASIPT